MFKFIARVFIAVWMLAVLGLLLLINDRVVITCNAVVVHLDIPEHAVNCYRGGIK